jgi:3-deoxy-D-arabino-heptulosonate 7-phosphate (DAHP) synthase class II
MGIEAGTAMLISAAVGAATAGTQMVMQKQEGDEAKQRAQEEKAAGESAMMSQKREEDMINRAANREQADPMALLDAEQNAAGTMNRTRLSGQGGVDPEQLRLGTSALLGE